MGTLPAGHAPVVGFAGYTRNTFADSNCDGIDGQVMTGTFVSPAGNDGNPGTMAMPVLTIAHAIMIAHGYNRGLQFLARAYTMDNGA